MNSRLFVVVYAALLTVFAGCVYSFSGASIPPHLKTIAIPVAADQSGSGDPNLRNEYSTQLVDRFVRDNSLQLTDRENADCVLESVITNIQDASAVVQAGEQVTSRRMTISVRVVFQDLKLRKKVWEKNFSNWGDFDPKGGFSQRNEAIKEAVRKMVEDILIETVSGW